MNHRLHIFISLSFLFLFSFCKTKDFTPVNFEGEKIIFGTSGGFTGALDAYHLISNGQLYKQEGRKEVFTALPSLKKKEALAIFQQVLDLKLNEMKFDDPGNLSKFIEFQSGDTKNKIVWSDENKDFDPTVEKFYNSLFDLTKVVEVEK